MNDTCLIPIWIVVYLRAGLYIQFCVSRILTRGCYFVPGHKNIPVTKILAPTPLRRVKLITWWSASTTATSYCHVTLARADNKPCRKTSEFSHDLSKMRPVHVVTSIMCHLKLPLRYGDYLSNKFNRTIVRCMKFKRAMLFNLLTAK